MLGYPAGVELQDSDHRPAGAGGGRHGQAQATHEAECKAIIGCKLAFDNPCAGIYR
jgi:hypothetical protein